MALNKAFKYLDMRSKSEEVDNISLHQNCEKMKAYSMQGDCNVEYLREGSWKTISKNKSLESNGLDRTLLKVLERTMSGRRRFIGYTCVTLIDNDGDTYSYNAHPYYHDAPWYD